MGRSRASARAAGTRFESSITAYLRKALGDERIERRAKTGAKDRGDVTGVITRGLRVVIECKDVARLDLGGWVREAEVERGNDDAGIALVAHKRRGTADPADQYVTMTMRDLVALMTGERPA